MMTGELPIYRKPPPILHFHFMQFIVICLCLKTRNKTNPAPCGSRILYCFKGAKVPVHTCTVLNTENFRRYPCGLPFNRTKEAMLFTTRTCGKEQGIMIGGNGRRRRKGNSPKAFYFDGSSV